MLPVVAEGKNSLRLAPIWPASQQDNTPFFEDDHIRVQTGAILTGRVVMPHAGNAMHTGTYMAVFFEVSYW